MTRLLLVAMLMMSAAVCVSAEPQEDRIDRFLKSARPQMRIPGMSVAVLKGGKVVKNSAYGLANVEYEIPAKPDTLYLLASITKVFTATLVMMLVEEGKFSLDDSITTYLPDGPEAWKPITIRMLLGHTGGLKDRWEEKQTSHWRVAYSTADMYAAAKETRLDFEPGTRWQYSDQGYFLLGMIVESVTGKSYKENIEGRICRPAGMTRTTLTSQTELIGNLAQGYTQMQGKWLKNHRRTDYGLVSHFGILSTAEELAKFDQALMSGRLLKPESLASMWVPTKTGDGMVGESTFGSYGIGWFLDEFNGHRIVQHGGASGTEYLKYPDDDVTVIVLTNLEQLAGGDATLLAKTIAQAYVSGLTWSELTVRGDPDPQLGQIVLAELKNLATGAMNEALYAPAYAKLLAPTLPSQKAGLTQLGPIEACEYVGGRNMGVVRAAYYRVHFRALTVYATIHLDKERKIVKFTLQADTILGN